VSLSWTITPRDRQRIFKVIWEESGLPATSEPRTNGLGSTLIDRVIPGANVERELRPDGLVCTMELALPEEKDEDAGAPNQNAV
jgi:two-component system CheB/CheR fusion protein